MPAQAQDIVILPQPQSSVEGRNDYKNAVLKRTLEITEEEYGPYHVIWDGPAMNRRRAAAAIKFGDLINVYFSVESPLWRANAIEIAIPIRRGILNYRVILIHKDNAEKFSKITTLEQLKAMKLGVQNDWETGEILAQYGFEMVTGNNYDGMFSMLAQQRFDYMLRGAHEVYGEMAWRDPDRSSLMIVPHLLLYIPALTYTYVSPEHPRLAQRIEQGLTTMVNSGELHQLFQAYYGDLIRQVDLPSRKMLFLNEQHAQTWARESQLLYPAPQPGPATPN